MNSGVKGVGEAATTPLGIARPASDPLAGEGPRSGSPSTALPGPFLPTASVRGHQRIHGFPLCTGEMGRDKNPQRALREESYIPARAYFAFPMSATGHRNRAGWRCSPGPALLRLSERIAETRGEGVGGRGPWKD